MGEMMVELAAQVREVERDSAQWPTGLNDLQDETGVPSMLWVAGSLPVGVPRVAIVGSRAATREGVRLAAELAKDLAGSGIDIVSGGAFGIDAAAHWAALQTGRTVAVMPGGLDRLYPVAHGELFKQISMSGALVSQYPLGVSPARFRFLERNALIAALADVVVVVEAGMRSGSMNTARRAARLGRPVGAVPGPVDLSTHAGSNTLIHDGAATLIRDADDVRELLERRTQDG